MADRFAENGAIQYALANPEAGSKRAGLSGYIMGALEDWLKNPVPPLSRLSAPGRLRGKFFDSGIAPLAMDFANQQFYSNQNGVMEAKSFSDIVNFSRTSNATVTRADGTIGYAPHNLLTHSEQFDNAAWSKTTTTVTANAIAAPDNTTTADTLTANGANSTTLQTYTAVAQPYVFSVWIRRRTGTGTIEITADGSTYSTVAITSSWARYETTVTPTAGSRTAGIRIVTSGDAIDVWGADLEIGSTATTYNSTTVKNLLGFSESFDNAAWTKSNSFVQTNLLTYSEAFDNAVWTKTASTAVANSVVAPNGYQTADTLLASAGTNQHSFAQTGVSMTSGVAYTISVYAKKGTNDFIQVRTLTAVGGATRYVNFDLASGIAGNTGNGGSGADATGTITSLSDGWYRCSITFSSSATATGGVSLYLVTNIAAPAVESWTAVGTELVYIWGAQLVQGSVAGDYRRTDAAALPIFYPNHNGVVCAEKLVENTATTVSHSVGQIRSVLTAPNTFSVYLKAGERTWAAIRYVNSSDIVVRAWYNLATGVVGSVDAGVTASMQSVGNGWYRCVYTIASPSASNYSWLVNIATANNVVDYTGDGTSGIYIFGAQLSDSASLDPYVLNAGAAPSAAAYYGPRFDYDPVTLQPKGLLIEEQRSNMLLNSELSGTNLATQNVTVTAVAHTLSFYGTGSITLSGTASATLTGTGAYPTRSTLTFTPTAGTLTLTVTGTVQYAQLEAGAFATSYIPTAASQVTRTADVATIQGSNFYSFYNQNEGSIFTNSNPLALGTYRVININDGTGNNRILMSTLNASGQYLIQVGGVSQVDLTVSGGYTANIYSKQAIGYKLNNFANVINNGTVLTDTSGTTPLVNVLSLSSMNGNIKQITYYPTRLSNDVLRGLTA